jgi:hypothetical protein
MQVELAHSTSVKEVENFDKNVLKNVETLEKNPLPDADGKSFFQKNIIDFTKVTSYQTVSKN